MGRRLVVLVFIFYFAIITGFSQTQYDSRNGGSMPAHGKFRILNIFINIIYDQTPDRDPYAGQDTPQWRPGNPDVLNDSPPTYLLKFLDTALTSQKPQGLMTTIFYESSLGHLIMLGDFVVVNIRQSEITPAKPGSNFGTAEVIRAALTKINSSGGLKTIYGHDHLSDYDFFEKGYLGVPKKMIPNGKIDFMMFFTRNTGRKEGGAPVYNYGQHNPGEGNSWESAACSKCTLLIDGQAVTNEITTAQNVGIGDLSQVYKNIAFHEFSHNLFGGNDFHTSGGNHFGTSNPAVFTGLQGGYGLMGGANASLVSCNGYERWRMGWIDTLNNPNRYEIAVNGANGAISKDDGPKTFILRDFVTSGDAIRIQLPYVDAGAEHQYLWLENHQVGRNHAVDFLQFSSEDNCRPSGSPGIYAYIQVGRDHLSSEKVSTVFTPDETDNLRMLTAKGNWDMRLDTYYDTTNCIAWRQIRPAESYKRENAFCGYNDMQSHCWDTTGHAAKIDGHVWCTYPWIIRRMGIKEAPLPFLGDNLTAFSGRSHMDMGSNPAAVNVVTHYTSQYGMQFKTYNKTNNKTIYLSGLSIKMQDLGDLSMRIEIRWDDYTIRNNVRWTGTIALKEKLIIGKKVTALLDQNETPVQLDRDSVSGYFGPITVFSCDSGSTMEMQKASRLVLDQKSSFIVRKGARIIFDKGCNIIIRNGSVFRIEAGAIVEDLGAKIKVKSEAQFIKP